MTEKERYGYLTGMIDMLSYQALLSGDQKRAMCVSDGFYRDEGMQKRLLDAFYGFPDKAPEAIVVVTMKKACGG